MNSPETKTVSHIKIERRVVDVCGDYDLEADERTLDGVVEVMAGLQESMRAVHLDWQALMVSNRAELERLAAPHVDEINKARREIGQPEVDLKKIDTRFLLGLAEPDWESEMPHEPTVDEKANGVTIEEVAQRWENFKNNHPDLADNLEDWYMYRVKLQQLREDERLMEQFDDNIRGERMAATRAAAVFWQAKDREAAISREIADMRERAIRSGRELTTRERRRIATLEKRLDSVGEGIDIPSGCSKEGFLAEVMRLQVLRQKRELDSGLLRTSQMQEIIDQSLPAMVRGEPVLFVGETGGAKTALAEYISKNLLGVDPEFISAYGDVNSYQIIGKQELTAESGQTESTFVPGPIVRAMEQGKPLILDEINAMPPEILKRLNKIMQLRPGDRFSIQEDSGRVVTVAKGFCIIATANEKSKRYKGVDSLSAEFKNRFSANTYRVRYPDHAAGYDEFPRENAQLAMAAIATERGELPPEISEREFDNFVRAARLSQQIFAGTNGEEYDRFVDTDRIVDGLPGLEDTVIAPRTMVDILRSVVESRGAVSLPQKCETFLDGVENPNDRKVLYNILKYHNLLPMPPEEIADDLSLRKRWQYTIMRR